MKKYKFSLKEEVEQISEEVSQYDKVEFGIQIDPQTKKHNYIVHLWGQTIGEKILTLEQVVSDKNVFGQVETMLKGYPDLAKSPLLAHLHDDPEGSLRRLIDQFFSTYNTDSWDVEYDRTTGSSKINKD